MPLTMLKVKGEYYIKPEGLLVRALHAFNHTRKIEAFCHQLGEAFRVQSEKNYSAETVASLKRLYRFWHSLSNELEHSDKETMAKMVRAYIGDDFNHRSDDPYSFAAPYYMAKTLVVRHLANRPPDGDWSPCTPGKRTQQMFDNIEYSLSDGPYFE